MVLPMSTATPKETPRTWSRFPRLAGRRTGGVPVGFAAVPAIRAPRRHAMHRRDQAGRGLAGGRDPRRSCRRATARSRATAPAPARNAHAPAVAECRGGPPPPDAPGSLETPSGSVRAAPTARRPAAASRQAIGVPVARQQGLPGEHPADRGIARVASLEVSVGHDVEQRPERRAAVLDRAVLEVASAATRFCAPRCSSPRRRRPPGPAVRAGASPRSNTVLGFSNTRPKKRLHEPRGDALAEPAGEHRLARRARSRAALEVAVRRSGTAARVRAGDMRAPDFRAPAG